uniref:Uncharacterized protein n=1 Tax=Solanum lycopersicum TaxID=4081 RepID=A0A3Q7F9E9_SOLLC
MKVRSNNNFKPNNSSNKCPKREWYDTWLDAVNEKVLYLQLCIKAYEVYFYNNKGKLQYLYFQQNTLIKLSKAQISEMNYNMAQETTWHLRSPLDFPAQYTTIMEQNLLNLEFSENSKSLIFKVILINHPSCSKHYQ